MTEPLTISINGTPVTASMDEWASVFTAIIDRRMADTKAWEQERRDAGQVWYALYWRHYSECVDECFSREDAEAVMERDDQASAGIVNPDGTFDPEQMYDDPGTLKHFKRELAEFGVVATR